MGTVYIRGIRDRGKYPARASKHSKEEMDMAIDRFLIYKINTCTYEPMRINLLKLLLIRIEKALVEEEAIQ